MSVLTIALIAVVLVVVLGLAMLIADSPIWGVERYGISVRELPNVAADIGVSDRNSARR